MKVGVITFWSSKDNYGQILQCYAMQRYLQQLGHNPFLIRYTDSPSVTKPGFKLSNILRYVFQLPKYLSWYLNQKKIQNDNTKYQKSVDFEKRNFSGFLEKHINSSEVYNDELIHAYPPVADVYICGSDQIWAGDRAYYLTFAPDDKIKIAYAPSLGGLTTFTREKEVQIHRDISRLDRIGMREESGVQVCKRLGYSNAIKVVDPTFLLNASQYRSISIKPSKTNKYIFVYLLGNPVDHSIEEISKFSKSKNLDIIYVASQGRNDEYPKENPTIEEWLGYIDNAEMVITNSFHCVAFSLQFHTDFIAIPLSKGYERMNTRIEELLKECSLEHHLLSSSLDEYKVPPANFSEFEKYISNQRLISQEFLSF